MLRKVLLLEANSIQSQPIAKSLKKKGFYTIGFCEEKLSYGYYSKYFDEKYLTCSCAHEPDTFFTFLVDYLKNTHVDVIIPMSDHSAVFLAKNRKELLAYTTFSIPSYENFMKGYDKNQLMKVCKELGVAHPMTVDLAEDYTLSGMKYPAIIKPNLTTGGRGMSIVNNQGELEAIIEPTIEKYGNSHVQEFVPAGGRQIKVQLLVDDSQNLLSSSVMCKKRMYPVKGGSSCCNVTMRNEELISTCHQVLKTIEWRGFADFDIIEDPRDNSLKIMEINPRIPACIKSTVAAGIDWGEAIVCEALDHPVPAYSYREGVVLRYLGFDVLWFLKSDDRFKAKPSWFKFFGSNVSYEDVDITDIKSFIMGTYGNIKKLLDPNFRAAKSGTN